MIGTIEDHSIPESWKKNYSSNCLLIKQIRINFNEVNEIK